LGRGPLDDPSDGGIEVDIGVGDIIVLPVRLFERRRVIQANRCRPVSVTALSILRVGMST
jgi:hypothetical protein